MPISALPSRDAGDQYDSVQVALLNEKTGSGMAKGIGIRLLKDSILGI
jgi:hypothetical protein